MLNKTEKSSHLMISVFDMLPDAQYWLCFLVPSKVAILSLIPRNRPARRPSFIFNVGHKIKVKISDQLQGLEYWDSAKKT